jgi:hypothetical protein
VRAPRPKELSPAETPSRGDDKTVFEAKMALSGTFWHYLAPFGTLFRGGAWKRLRNAECLRLNAKGTSPLQIFVFHAAGANYLPDLGCSTTRNNVKERADGSDKSLLKLYYFFTGSGFF